MELRGMVLALTTDQVSVAKGRPIAVLMETGFPEGVVTLACVADGSTSLYFSNGGGVIGAGSHAEVRDAAKRFLDDVAGASGHFTATTDHPLPATGRVRFYVVTAQGLRTEEASENDLGEGKTELSPTFYSAQAVITAIRKNNLLK